MSCARRVTRYGPDMTNPLMDVLGEIPFDQIEPQHVLPAVDAALADAEAKLEQVKNAPTPYTYDGTLGELERLTERVETTMTLVDHLESVASGDALRTVHQQAEAKVAAFFSSLPLDEALWKVVRGCVGSAEFRQRSREEQRYGDETARDFRNAGAELDPEAKQELQQVNVELTQLCTQFAQNVLDATNAFKLNITRVDALQGLPDAVLEAAKARAEQEKESGYSFNLQAPSFLPIMMYADDARLRERMYKAHSTRASAGSRQDNTEIIERVLKLRAQKARLLGQAHFADHVMQDRMAKSGKDALAFILDLSQRTKPFFDKENQELLSFRRHLEGEAAPPLEPWDVAYYAEKLRKAQFDISDEELRPYYPTEHVLEGIFELSFRLYGVTFEETSDAPRWHQDVKVYRVLNEQRRLLGTIYVDLYPRANKRDGAWMNGLRTAAHTSQSTTHLGVVCANLTPPSPTRPSLLNVREVETLFHEFGHLLHHCLSRVSVRSLGGTRVAWDFVELPSQIMENWVWEKEGQALISKHYETGAPLPDVIFDRLTRSRTFRGANAMMRQLGFAHLDLELHMQPTDDAVAHARALLAHYTPTPLPSDYSMLTGFSHIFAHPVGYAAGYYAYKWAEVLEADAFSRFREAGIFSRDTGRAFEQAILSAGNTAPAEELFQQFVGREPRLEPLLERAGLAPAASAPAASAPAASLL